jgi:WD40 repeat protein
VIDEWLEHVDAHMCVAALNQWGTVLATGCLDGTILLWNMDTRGLARVHEPHNCIPTGCAEARTENIPDVAVDAPAAKVTALGWAHNGHAFATGSVQRMAPFSCVTPRQVIYFLMEPALGQMKRQ